MSGSWSLALTHPNGENIASENLTRQNFQHQIFRIRTLGVSRGRRVERVLPAFPRYVFVFIQETWRSLRGTRGIADLVWSGQTPARVPQRVMDGLLARTDARGFLRDDSVAAQDYLPGEKMHVNEGAFAGFNALFECRTGEERVRVLLNLMGRQVAVEVGDAAVSRV